MNMFRLLVLILSLLVLVPKAQVSATEDGEGEDDKGWKVSVGGGLIIAPAFTGSRNYTFIAVPDLRVAHKNLFFANIRDGIGYAVFNQERWRIGLEQYHADAGITAYGISCFAMMPLTESFSVSLTAGFDRLAATVTNSPLVRFRGTENQAMGGMFIKYGF